VCVWVCVCVCLCVCVLHPRSRGAKYFPFEKNDWKCTVEGNDRFFGGVGAVVMRGGKKKDFGGAGFKDK
jgi:hypothetical protein